jgi:hypothetical protein
MITKIKIFLKGLEGNAEEIYQRWVRKTNKQKLKPRVRTWKTGKN